ncbi:DUF2471 family protein, partial [Paraburkholderia tropica]
FPANAAQENDPVALKRAAQRAALDLQRIVVLLLQRNVSARRSATWRPAPAVTWRTVLDIEEQAFANPGFQGKYPARCASQLFASRRHPYHRRRA